MVGKLEALLGFNLEALKNTYRGFCDKDLRMLNLLLYLLNMESRIIGTPRFLISLGSALWTAEQLGDTKEEKLTATPFEARFLE
jgi:hypothetical protein